MTIRTAFIFDEGAVSLSESVQDAIGELNAIAGLSPGRSLDIAVALQTSQLQRADLQNSYDLVVIDYGGVGVWNQASANAQIWAVCAYAEDHPSTLVVIWTGFTARVYREQIEPQFANVSNIVCRYGDSVYEDLNGSPGFLDTFRRWFNAEIETVSEPEEA